MTLSSRAILWVVLNGSSAIDHGLDMQSHLLHPLELNIYTGSAVSRRSDRQSVGLLIALLRDVDGVLSTWCFSNPSRWSRYRRVGWLYFVVVRGVGNLGLKCQ